MWGLPAWLQEMSLLYLWQPSCSHGPQAAGLWAGLSTLGFGWASTAALTHSSGAPLYHAMGEGIAQKLSFEVIFRIVLSKYGNPRFFKPQNILKKILLFLWLGLLQWITQNCEFKEKKSESEESSKCSSPGNPEELNFLYPYLHISLVFAVLIQGLSGLYWEARLLCGEFFLVIQKNAKKPHSSKKIALWSKWCCLLPSIWLAISKVIKWGSLVGQLGLCSICRLLFWL